jgi:hypothetical protein
MYIFYFILWYFSGIFGFWLDSKLCKISTTTLKELIMGSFFGPIIIVYALLDSDWGRQTVFNNRKKQK